MNPEWRSRYEVGLEITRRAARRALQYFTASVEVEWKQDLSPVTVADRETEAILRRELLEHFPSDGLLGEEHGDHPGSSGFRWVIDPIDGTRSFVRGIPLWATLVGLEYRDEPIAGIIDVPTLGHTYHAVLGGGAFRDNRPIHVSDTPTLDRSLMFYSSLSWFLKAGKEREFLHLVRQTERQRGYGDFYGFVLVAQGSGEVMAEHGVHVWDVAAVVPVVEEAGGRFTDWDGNRTIHRPDVVASNGLVHDATLRALRGQ